MCIFYMCRKVEKTTYGIYAFRTKGFYIATIECKWKINEII